MSWQLFEQPVASVALRSMLLLTITLAIAFVVRRRSAAVGHHVWVLGFCGCLLIPIVMLLAPNVAVPVLPPMDPCETVVVQPPGPTLGAMNREAMPSPAAPPVRIEAYEAAVDTGIERPPLAAQTAAQPTAIHAAAIEPLTFAWPAWQTWLLIMWAAGAAFCGARLLWQVRLVERAARACPALESETWRSLCDEVDRELGLRREISLRWHREALTPMVVGFWRPIVLVPSDADKWSAEQQRHVLLHELAHVQRHDVLAQLLAGSACVLYWFNPLAWWGAAQMRRLREIACDDVVVRHAQRPSMYAQTLLDVAKQYGCRQQVFSVAMARNAQVEGRIRAILDATRERAALSKRNARVVAIAAFAILFVVGTLQLTSRAQESGGAAPESERAAEAASNEAQARKAADAKAEDSRTRMMKVRVVDEAGKPISGANVHVSVWELKPEDKQYRNRDFKTDEQGLAEFEIPRGLEILRLWGSKTHFVPMFVNFGRGSHDEGRLIPEMFEFRLPAGHRLSGRVVDEAGQPIADAKVEVRVDVNNPFSGPNPKQGISGWLSSGEDAVRTDSEGRWEVTNAPAALQDAEHKFRLLVTHPDFAGVTNWGELQGKQGVTVEQLREGTAKITLDRGRAISGTITGPDGKPVTRGLVIWSDNTYFAKGVNETPIDADGKYKTLQLAAGEYPITVLAPGFAPEQRTVKLDDSLGPVDFKLAAGNTIRLRIVDSAGRPIPKAYVQIGRWRGSKAMYNEDHPNVPDSGIPRQADENGIYTWTWAPVDGVEYLMSAINFDAKELSLVAKPEPHEVVLTAAPTFFGKVVDAKTGEPIKKFRVVPVKAFQPDFYSTDFQDDRVVEGKDGQYRIEIETHGQTGNRYFARIEAEGYRTALGDKSLAAGDPPLELDFSLEPAPALRGVVVDESGSPVNEFMVAVGTPTTASDFSFDQLDTSFGIALRVEGTNEFRLPATFEPQRIRVFDETGYAEVFRQPNEDIGTLTLRPTASVSGRLLQAGEPLVGETIYCYPLANRGLKEARFQEGYTTKTDASGAFRFDRLPPGRYSIRPQLGPWEESVMTSGESIPLDLKPGDKKEITLGGGSVRLVGNVVTTGGNADKLSKRWSLNYLISRDRGVEYPADATPLSSDFRGPVQLSWLRQDDFQRWVATRENHFVKLAEDGRMVIQGVRPGEYDLVIQLYEQPAGCLVDSIGEKVVPVTVGEGEAEGVIGREAFTEQLKDVIYHKRAIVVPVRRGPRVGSDMRAYKFTDADGQVRMVNDLGGRYVLLDVWASWCQPCLASMPELKAAVEKYVDKPLTVVGLNVDKPADASVAKALAKEGDWNWAQNYLGDESDLMRQLGVSSVPAYYLIGPDGKLVGSANAWEQMAELLGTELSKGSK